MSISIKETDLKFNTNLSKRNITRKIVLHHADASNCDAATIHKWHIARGWAGIGYHFVVRKNGTIERGRPIDVIGAHCTGNNADSVGICFEGNFETEKMTDKQIKSGQELMSYLYKTYGLNKSNVKRHKDLMATSCPGKNFPFNEIIKGVTATVLSSTTNQSYTVKSGETLSKIGNSLNVKWEDIASLNGIKPPYTIKVGQELKIPNTAKKDIPPIALPTLKLGSYGIEVGKLQEDLNYLGFKGADGKKLTVDRDMGNNTVYALRSMQIKYNLVADSIYGQKSYEKMKSLLV